MAASYGQAENLPKSETTKDSKLAIDVEIDKYLEKKMTTRCTARTRRK